ncbi:hypothetical protein ACHAQD_010740 [Fusarium lateritium]
MTTKKLIVVAGATGGQGGSVVSTFLHDPEWLVRGITRNPSSPKAKSLKACGVDMVQADLDDKASLSNAFQDANAIFAVSDFWGIYNDPRNRDKPKLGQPRNEWTKAQETQQLKNIIDEAAEFTSLERFIISSLPNVTKLTGGGCSRVWGATPAASLVKDECVSSGVFLEQLLESSNGSANKSTPLIHGGSQVFKLTLRQQDNGILQFATNLDLDNKLPLIAHDQDSGPLAKALIQDNFAFANEVGLHGGDGFAAIHLCGVSVLP